MFRKTLGIASLSALLGMAALLPTAALAQFGPPPGPPPGLAGPPPGIAAPPPGLAGPASVAPRLAGPNGGPPLGGPGGARLGGAAPRFSRLDGAVAGRSLESRSAPAARSAAGGYGRYGYSRSGYGDGRGRYWARGVYAAYGSAYASSDDGCYYVSAYRRGAYRRVLVCD